MPVSDCSLTDRSPALSIEMRRIDALIPYAKNARKHSRNQIRKLQRSLLKFGWTNPILIDSNGNIVCGHGRLEAARLNGESQVPVISLGEMSEADRRAYIIADNRLAEEAEWSKALLRSELSGLIELGYEVELTGFDTFEIDGLLSLGEGEPTDEVVELPDEGTVPVSRLGDLWTVDEHRMIVGDAREASVYERLLRGERARMIITDPPYGCVISNNVSGNGRVKHGDFVMGAGEQSLPEFAMTLLRPAFRAMAAHCVPGAIAFVFMDWRGAPHMLDAAQGVFHEVKNLIVWAKTNAGMGAFYRSAHELCYAFKVSPGAHVSNIALGRRNRSNVWQYPGANTFRAGRMEDLADHPTVKNRQMIAEAILDVSRRGDIVLDPFAGSGTTGVSAHMTGRRACLVELDPLYADVILRRVSEVTGSEPLLDGKPFGAVREARLGDRS
jgi:DNA modification methylase